MTTFNLADLFESVADAVPDRVALVAGPRRLTYAELDARANRLAHALAARGVKAGEHVGLYLYNGAEFIEGMLAAFKLRAVPINVNYRYVEDELAYLVRNADLAAVIHQPELGDRLPPGIRLLVPAGEAYERLVEDAPSDRRFGPRSGDDLHIIYTGGTTGMPRGVMWRHEDLLFAGLQGGNPGGAPHARPGDVAPAAKARANPMVILPAAPLIHGSAQLATLIAFLSGGRVVLQAGKSFDAREVVRLVAAERVNTLNLVGDAMARPLAAALAEPGHDVSSLMVIASGGAILSPAVKAELNARLPYTMILDAFGASETGHQGMKIPGMPGASFVMDDTSTVLDPDGRPVERGSGVVGRLARRGRLPLGYYKDEAKTAATFLTIDGTRWCVPGDLATVEADGRITVLGRGAMCINSGGEKIFVEEVEGTLKAHPAVFDALVVGLPDERWGERVAAVVQLRPGAELTLEGAGEHCRRHLAGYKVPRDLRVVPEIHRHPSGKPDYRWAREVFGA
jgi:acyl-CoA synthetase (AMP-forming)/AMP-acid ligase II